MDNARRDYLSAQLISPSEDERCDAIRELGNAKEALDLLELIAEREPIVRETLVAAFWLAVANYNGWFRKMGRMILDLEHDQVLQDLAMELHIIALTTREK